MPWDVFISHATEDKADVAGPLAAALERAGISVWVDKDQIRLGDSLRAIIEHGLAHCRFGVVILSPAFFEKEWTQKELDALFALETTGRKKKILPVIHNMTIADVVVIASSLPDFLTPPPHSQLHPAAAIGTLLSWSVRYRLPVLFAGDREHAQAATHHLLRKFAWYAQEGTLVR